jgi:hypothetical protein
MLDIMIQGVTTKILRAYRSPDHPMSDQPIFFATLTMAGRSNLPLMR